eukprot:scaffold205253_cov38-Prasinocladus_malaysianus.AAC.1
MLHRKPAVTPMFGGRSVEGVPSASGSCFGTGTVRVQSSAIYFLTRTRTRSDSSPDRLTLRMMTCK